MRPPRLPSALLYWRLRANPAREFIIGDLREEYGERHKASAAAAVAWFWREALSFIYRHDDDDAGPSGERTPRTGRGGAVPGPSRGGRRGFELILDLRYAVRNLRRRPLFAAVAVISLALGIGATTLVFSAVNAMFLRPPAHVEAPQRLAAVYSGSAEGQRYSVSSYPDFLDVRATVDAFDDVAAYIVGDEMNLSSGEQTRPLFGETVSPNYFDLLGVTPALGRFFSSADLAHGGIAEEVVIGHGLWMRELGGDRSAIGRRLRIDGRSMVVVGVAPRGLRSLQFPVHPDVWVPMAAVRDRSGDAWLTQRGHRGLNLVARLADDATLDAARQQLDVLARRLFEEHPRLWSDNRGEPRSLTALTEAEARLSPGDRAAAAGFSAVLMVTVVLVLAISCSNLANLLLSRAVGREPETAVRLALGASRRRLIGMLLSESLLLAAAGGIAGTLAAHWLTRSIALGAEWARLPFQLDLTVDSRVLGFAVVTSLLTGLLFGIAPALRASRPDLLEALRGTAAAGGRRRSVSLRNVLIVGQVAVSLILVIAASLFLRSLQAAGDVDPGFSPDGVATLQLDLSQIDNDPTRHQQVIDDVLVRLRANAALDGAAVATSIPLGGSHTRWSFRIVGAAGAAAAPDQPADVGVNVVSPGYRALISMTLLSGRDLTATDVDGAPPVAMVNDAFVGRYVSSGDVHGMRIEADGASMEVVGVVATAKYRNLSEEPEPRIWVPAAQHPQSRVTLLARAADGRPSPVGMLREEVLAIEPELPLRAPIAFSEIVATSMAPQRAAAAVLGAAGFIALTLAIIGIYGVVAFSVSRRTREIGVRLALGAGRDDVVRMIVLESCALVAIGMALGLPTALALTQLLGGLLTGVSPMDPASVVGGCVALAMAALCASLAPARRATRVDPLITLRSE